MRRPGATAVAVAALAVVGSAATGAGAAVAPSAAADLAAAAKAVLKASDLPGRFTVTDSSATVFLTALTGVAACDPSPDGLAASAAAASPAYRRGPLIVSGQVVVFGPASDAGEALVREVRTATAACVRRRAGRAGFGLSKLAIQDVPSLGVGAVRIRATLVLLPAGKSPPVIADTVLALRGRALIRLRALAVTTPIAASAENALVTAMGKRLPAS